MRDLSDIVSRRLLPAVSRPSQYVGLETNAVHADVESAEVSLVLAFPDAYAIGISHLGGAVLYALANGIEGVACDRTYCPLPDAEAVMRARGVPLFAWESRRAVADFDILGFSLAHEGCYTNVLTMLDLAGVPIRAAERTDQHPVVIAGDAGSDAPEPMADFIDVFCVGDGEITLPAVIECVRAAKRGGLGREETLLEIARNVPGAYVPRFYCPEYRDDGKFAGFIPHQPPASAGGYCHRDGAPDGPVRVVGGLPPTIDRARLANLSDSPALTAPLVPLAEAVHDRVTIEIMRGCPHGCRFCQAGATRKPVRWRSVEEIIDIARKALAATGYRDVSLLSLSTSDYPHFDELVDRLAAELTPRNISVSLPSLRVGSQLAAIPKLTSQVRKSGLTIAAEAGSERMRRAIRKSITEEQMLEGVSAAWRAGYRSVKLYFMAGFPGETDADIDAIFELCRRLSDSRRAVDGRRGSINAAVSWLVPRPHTPMQWAPLADTEYRWSVRNRLRDLSRRTPVQFKFHRIERSVLEAVLSRGDRRVGAAIEAAWRAGARFDGWDEHFDWSIWEKAFETAGIDVAFYARRPRGEDELFPWDHIEGHQGKAHLLAEWRRIFETLAE